LARLPSSAVAQRLVHIPLGLRVAIPCHFLRFSSARLLICRAEMGNLPTTSSAVCAHLEGTRDASNVQDAVEDCRAIPVAVSFNADAEGKKSRRHAGQCPPVRPEWPDHPVRLSAGISSSPRTASRRSGRAIPRPIAPPVHRSWFPSPPNDGPARPACHFFHLDQGHVQPWAIGKCLLCQQFPQPCGDLLDFFNFCSESFLLAMSCSSLNLRRPINDDRADSLNHPRLPCKPVPAPGQALDFQRNEIPFQRSRVDSSGF